MTITLFILALRILLVFLHPLCLSRLPPLELLILPLLNLHTLKARNGAHRCESSLKSALEKCGIDDGTSTGFGIC